MEKLNVGYFKSFGGKDIEQARENFERKHDIRVQLYPLYQDQVGNFFEDGKIDLAITDPRDNDFNDLKLEPLAKISLVAILQAGNFMESQQTVEMKDLSKIPNILIATPKEEHGELHYHKDVLGITSPFIAVDSFSEAALMAASGSGYFLMNERTAPLINNDQLQKMFLLNDGQQLKQNYAAVYREKNAEIADFIQEMKQIIQ